MADRRRVSITAKVTVADYDAIVRRAAPQMPATWAHAVLRRALKGPDPIEVTLLAEVLALSRLVTNVVDILARQQPVTQAMVRQMKDLAAKDKREMAMVVLQKEQS